MGNVFIYQIPDDLFEGEWVRHVIADQFVPSKGNNKMSPGTPKSFYPSKATPRRKSMADPIAAGSPCPVTTTATSTSCVPPPTTKAIGVLTKRLSSWPPVPKQQERWLLVTWTAMDTQTCSCRDTLPTRFS